MLQELNVFTAVMGSNTQYHPKVVTGLSMPVRFLKVPVNYFGTISKVVDGKSIEIPLIPFGLQRLYIKYLDCKAQSIEGVFMNPGSRKWGPARRQHYRRAILALKERGWAEPCGKGENGDISLRAYQYVWRDLGIKRFSVNDNSRFMASRRGSGERYSYFKIPLDDLADDPATYSKEIQDTINKYLSKRKRAQMRWRLKKSSSKVDLTQATFSAKRAALLFGYRSPSTGSKLRKKYFSIVETTEKPGFNPVRGRWEEPCKRVAL